MRTLHENGVPAAIQRYSSYCTNKKSKAARLCLREQNTKLSHAPFRMNAATLSSCLKITHSHTMSPISSISTPLLEQLPQHELFGFPLRQVSKVKDSNSLCTSFVPDWHYAHTGRNPQPGFFLLLSAAKSLKVPIQREKAPLMDSRRARRLLRSRLRWTWARW